MWGSSRFKWVSGKWYPLGIMKTTNLDITDADADSATGVIKRGNMMDVDPTDETEMVYGSGNALGILTYDITLNGITDAQGFKSFTIGKYDLPKKRGAAISLRVPQMNAIAEFEGTGTPIVDNLVADSGVGALAAGTAVGTALSVENGCWRVAQTSDVVLARLLRANLTPENAGELRIRVQFVSPTIA